MLIQASNISPGDVVITPVYQDGEKVSQVYLLEDGSVRIEYETGKLEWLSSKQVVVRRDSNENFYRGDVFTKNLD